MSKKIKLYIKHSFKNEKNQKKDRLKTLISINHESSESLQITSALLIDKNFHNELTETDDAFEVEKSVVLSLLLKEGGTAKIYSDNEIINQTKLSVEAANTLNDAAQELEHLCVQISTDDDEKNTNYINEIEFYLRIHLEK